MTSPRGAVGYALVVIMLHAVFPNGNIGARLHLKNC